MNYHLIFFIIFNAFAFISVYYTLKYLNNQKMIFNAKRKVFELNNIFLKNAKSSNKNKEDMISLHLNTCMSNILIDKLNNLESDVFFVINMDKNKFKKEYMLDILEIIYRAYYKDYDINHFILDLEILKTKDTISKELRLKSLLCLIEYIYREKYKESLIENLLN